MNILSKINKALYSGIVYNINMHFQIYALYDDII